MNHEYKNGQMFSVTVTDSFNQAVSSIAHTVIEDTVKQLSAIYGFDVEEALGHILSGGLKPTPEVKKIPRNAMPWCGEVISENCKALAYNSGLFTQCPQKSKDGDWCTKCAKQVAKNGTPTNGDVDQRLACGLMAYKVGNRTTVPYADWMIKHLPNHTRQDVEDSAKLYGLTIDPVQFVRKQRGRPKTTTMHMTTPSEELPLPEAEEALEEVETKPSKTRSKTKAEESTDEVETKPPKAKTRAKPKAEESTDEVDTKPSKAEESTKSKAIFEAKLSKAILEEGELEEGELEEEEVSDEETPTAEEINSLTIGDLRKLAEKCGIAVKENGKAIPPKELRVSVRDHFNV